MSDMKKNPSMVSITDALKGGATPEELRKGFEAALQESIKEAEAEKKKAFEQDRTATMGAWAPLDTVRHNATVAIIKYLKAVGILPDEIEISDEDIRGLEDSIKEVEKEYQQRKAFMNILRDMAAMDGKMSKNKSKGDKKSSDDIIADFLKNL